MALKFFSTLSGVKADKMGTLKLNHDHSEGNCEICDSGRIEETLEALARYCTLVVKFRNVNLYEAMLLSPVPMGQYSLM